MWSLRAPPLALGEHVPVGGHHSQPVPSEVLQETVRGLVKPLAPSYVSHRSVSILHNSKNTVSLVLKVGIPRTIVSLPTGPLARYLFFFLIFFPNVYLFLGQRETEHERGRGEREGDTESETASRL